MGYELNRTVIILYSGIFFYQTCKFKEKVMRSKPFTLEEVTLLLHLIENRRDQIRGLNLHEEMLLRRLYQRFDRMTSVL